MAAGVVAHATADGLGNLGQVGNQRVDVKGRERGMILEEIIGVGDVGIVVLAVMDLHRLGVDVRLERGQGVGKFREFEGHGNGCVFLVEGNVNAGGN